MPEKVLDLFRAVDIEITEIAKKVQSSLPQALQDSQYHPETAGKLMAIPEVMAYFVTKASDLESLALLESIVLNQPIVKCPPMSRTLS